VSAVEFPDVVGLLVDHLGDRVHANGYPDAHVSDVYRGDSVEVWLQRDGGASQDVREFPRIRVNVFHEAQTAVEVDAFAQRISALMRGSAGYGPIKRVRQLTGPTPSPDVKPRRYMLSELPLVGSTLTIA